MNAALAGFTVLHVAVSLVGIAAGVVVAAGLLMAKPFSRWTKVFLATTLATSVSGFGFPVDHWLPSHTVGVISIAVLGLAALARYRFRLAGAARGVYVVTAMVALYLNVFVLIVQAFLKVPGLRAIAPTQSEPPFLVVQVLALALVVVVSIAALIRFRPDGVGTRVPRPRPAPGPVAPSV